MFFFLWGLHQNLELPPDPKKKSNKNSPILQWFPCWRKQGLFDFSLLATAIRLESLRGTGTTLISRKWQPSGQLMRGCLFLISAAGLPCVSTADAERGRSVPLNERWRVLIRCRSAFRADVKHIWIYGPYPEQVQRGSASLWEGNRSLQE